MKNNKKTKLPAKRKLIIAATVVAVILILIISVFVFFNDILNDINRLPSNNGFENLEQLEGVDPDGEIVEKDPVVEEAEKILNSKNVINILLVGQDRRSNEVDENARTDSMILCTVNLSKNTLTMTSFMRDMWVYIPDHYNSRINSAYMLGGFDLLNKTLEYNFGASGEYNIEIDFSGFMELVDSIGGVDVELTAAEAKYLNRRGNWDIEQNCDWELVKGVNRLTGSQALAYSRIRQIGDDFERTNRQRTVLTAMIDKAKTLGFTETYRLVRSAISLISTDMTNTEIMALAMALLPKLDTLEIVSQRIPADGEYSFATKPSGASVIELSPKNFEANKKLLITAMEE